MKTFAKKSLSVLLAMLMALSALTVGTMSAFAAEKQFAQYTAGMQLEKGKTSYIKFTAPATGEYSFTVDVAPVAEDLFANAGFEVCKEDEKKPSQNDEYICEGYSSSTTASYIDAGVLKEKKIYAPAQDTARLVAGVTYNISVSVNANTNAVLNIYGTEFSYYIESYSEELVVTKNSDGTDIESPYSVERTVGLAAHIEGYKGISTSVAIPAVIAGYRVDAVTLYDTDSALRKRITSVSVPEGVTKIGAMGNMYSLSSVNFPTTLKEIDDSAFANTALSGRIAIPAGVKEIGSCAFYNTAIDSVDVQGFDTVIGYHAFGYKDALNEATVDPTDTTIASVAGFMVLAPANSNAALYAAQNGFVTYDPANCAAGNHPYATTTVPATLFAKGSVTSVCPVCGATTKQSINKKTFKISSLKSSKKGTIVVKAAKQEGILGYKVEYSTSKKFTKKTTKTVTVKSTKALSKTIKGLKSGKKYYVRVRAYAKANGKTVFSKYTAVKSVKVK